jgi:hypothetical protein
MVCESGCCGYLDRFPISDFRFPISDFRFPMAIYYFFTRMKRNIDIFHIFCFTLHNSKGKSFDG